MGVSISEHKSILPSALAGAEFASKLMTIEANYSPLPTLLLSKGDLTSKVQFLTEVVNRVVTEVPQSHPSLDLICQAVFGKRLAYPLGDLFCRYYLFKQFTATSKGVANLREGILPERVKNIYDNDSLLSQFDFLLTILESTKLEDYGVTLTKLNHLVVKELEKATKLVMKDVISSEENRNLLKSRLDKVLGVDGDLEWGPDHLNFLVNLANYLKGPRVYFAIELGRTIEEIERISNSHYLRGREATTGVTEGEPRAEKHEQFTVMDSYLRRDALKLLDSCMH